MSFFFELFRSLSAAAAFSGFGVPGTEIWFGLHLWVDDLHSGPFLGAFTAHFVDGMRMWSEQPRNWLPDRGNSTLPFAQVLLAEGNASHSVHYAYEVLEFFTASDGSRYGSKFLMLRQEGTEGHGLPAVFELTSLAGGHDRLLFSRQAAWSHWRHCVAADSRTRWASGGEYYEGVVEARDVATGKLIGYGYTEGVGWDRQQISRTVATALRDDAPSAETVGLLSSRPPHTQPPPRY